MEFIIYVLHIEKKGGKKSTNNCKGISAMSPTARIFSVVLQDKIGKHMYHYEEESGFQKAKSCLNKIFFVRQVIEKPNKEKNFKTYMTFTDEKACDSVPTTAFQVEQEW